MSRFTIDNSVQDAATLLNSFMVNSKIYKHVINLENDATYLVGEDSVPLFIVTSDGVLYDSRDQNKVSLIGKFKLIDVKGHEYSWKYVPVDNADINKYPEYINSDLLKVEFELFKHILTKI